MTIAHLLASMGATRAATGLTDPRTYDQIINVADWATLQTAAIDNKQIGMNNGTYPVMHLTRPGVTYEAINPHEVIVELEMAAPDAQLQNEFYHGTNSDDLTLIGLRINSAISDRNTVDTGTPGDIPLSHLSLDTDGGVSLRVRLYNCIIHDIYSASAFHGSSDVIVQDCLSYNQGIDGSDRGHGHDWYFDNLPSTGTTKQIINCMGGQGFAEFCQMYDADTANDVYGLYVDKAITTLLNNPSHIFGSENGSAVDDIRCTNGAFLGAGVDFGFASTAKTNGILTGNFWPSDPLHVSSGWTNLTNSGNTRIDTGEHTFVYPCESGAWLAVAHLGWRSNSSASSMTFDVSACGMVNGASYRLRNGENPFNEATTGANNIIDFVYGTTPGYGGGTITVPTTGRTRATPYGGIGTTHSVPDLTTNLAKIGIWKLSRTA
jgi:hypothetical protein